ncbi:MAG: O-antigen ligase family protein [Chitinophagaceae bacterium]|nr:O-antigen ligase family protein [Chitinophagaceae bacterium]
MKISSFSVIHYLQIAFAVLLLWFLAYLYDTDNSLIFYHWSTYLCWLCGAAGWVVAAWKKTATNRELFGMLTLCVLFYLLFILPHDPGCINPLIMLYATGGLYSLLSQLTASAQEKKGVISLFILLWIFTCHGMIQGINHDWRSLDIKALFFNAGYFGNYLITTIPLVFSFLLYKGRRIDVTAVAGWLLFVMALTVLLLTQARAAIVGCTAGCMLATLLYMRERIRRKLLLLMAVALVLIPLLLAVAAKTGSSRGRLTIYTVTLEMIRDHPMSGTGAGRFGATYNEYQAHYFQHNDVHEQTAMLADNTYEAFNILLQLLAEYGIAGLVLLVVIIRIMIKRAEAVSIFRSGDWMRKGSAGCVAGIIFSAQFSNPFHAEPVLVVFIWHVAMLTGGRKQQAATGSLTGGIFKVVTVVLFTCLSYLIVLNMRAERQWKKAADLSVCCGFESAKVYYEKAGRQLKRNGIFLFNYGAEASLAGEYKLSEQLLEQSRKYVSSSFSYTYSGDNLLAGGNLKLAEEYYLKAAWMVPSHLVPKYKLVKLYQRTGEKEKAAYWRQKALTTPVKIPSNLMDELIFELRRGE